MPSARKVKRCAYCDRKFEQFETKYHSEEQYKKFKIDMSGIHGNKHYVPDTRKGLTWSEGTYYYSRPPYACKDCVNRSGGNPDLL